MVMAIFSCISSTPSSRCTITLHILLSSLLLLLSFANSIYFQIPRFDSSSSDMLYEGNAMPSDGAVEFNAVAPHQVGHAVYANPVLLWDNYTGEVSDFSSHFSFVIDTQNKSKYGDGLAFFIAPVGFSIPPNSNDSLLGLYSTANNNSSSAGSDQILHIEFDTYSNIWWDPPYEHVGINKNSIYSSANAAWNASLHSGDVADAWISYNATAQNLSVSWFYKSSPDLQGDSSISYQIDLKELLPSWVSVGFSASTGGGFERHSLKYWEFTSSLDIKERTQEKSRNLKLVLGLPVAAGVLFATIGGVWAFFICRRRWKRSRGGVSQTNFTSMEHELGAGPRKIPYRDLVLATNNFSEERKLGEGGFGSVYQGYLPNQGLAVAVKKNSRSGMQGKKQYITEVNTISRLRHRNLVQLIGWCHNETEFLLVYEYMQNGSLDFHLFGKKESLGWAVRYKIVLGLASALLYLHEEWEQCVVHRDIKASNIMLDSSFNVKLGDFGLARLMDHDLGPQITDVAGTLGYLAPECLKTFRASTESDVYSFGVVALEIASGRKCGDGIDGTSKIGLVECVWDLYGQGKILSAVDERLMLDFDTDQVECLLMVGLWCSHPDPSSRPSIKKAIQMLNFEVVVPELPMTRPSSMPTPPLNAAVASPNASITCTSIINGR